MNSIQKEEPVPVDVEVEIGCQQQDGHHNPLAWRILVTDCGSGTTLKRDDQVQGKAKQARKHKHTQTPTHQLTLNLYDLLQLLRFVFCVVYSNM